MSFGGHVFAMIATMKNNANLTKKRSYSDLYDHYERYKNARVRPMRKKNISKEKLKQIKEQIKSKKLVEKRKQIIISVILFTIIAFSSILMIQLISSNSAKAIQQRSIERKTLTKSEQEVFNTYMRNGKSALLRNNYKEAKQQFKLALTLNQYNYKANYSLSRAYTMDCIVNDIDCNEANKQLKKTIGIMGEMYELKKLEQLLINKKQNP